MKLRRFLDAEAKKPLQGDGIRPVEPVPYKITKNPFSKSDTLRLCPFCRKSARPDSQAGLPLRSRGHAPSVERTWAEAGEPSKKRSGAWNGRE